MHRILVFLAALIAAGNAQAIDEDQVNQAVQRAVGYLKQVQSGNGSWPAHHVGGTALVGLALLECDVPPNDAAVQQAANHLRSVWASIDDHMTYSLSLTILFLDRLGDSADEPIIQALAVRLLAGQNAEGGWDYGCPQLNAPDSRTLQSVMKQAADLKTTERPKPAARKKGGAAFPQELQQIVARMKQQPPLRKPTNVGGDNSNTQFAVLALWVARRHGVPVEQALTRTAARFRGGQNADGGWGYLSSANRPGISVSTSSMTCAGLLGLALGYGISREAVLRSQTDPRAPKSAAAKAAPVPAKDPAVRAGFAALSKVIGQPIDVLGPIAATPPGDLFYLLWSIERVAVAYDQALIAKKNWYDWGAGVLLPMQQADGGWTGKRGAEINTSFALLFLRRANLSRDLTPYLKAGEPVQTVLKAGVKEVAAAQPDLALGDSDASVTPKSPPLPAEKAAPVPETKAAKPEARKNADSKAGTAPSPPLAQTTDAAGLGEALLRASGTQQAQLMDQLKQGKGNAYTKALASAISRLNGDPKNKARDALAERLARMNAATLRDKLQDEDSEIRRAAALACAMKEDKQFLADLIVLLRDRQSTVVRAAHAALKALTGQDFGPAADASPDAIRKAVSAWEGWVKKQSGK